MAAIIFVEVIRRFLLNEQAAWSSTIPIYLFLWVVWIACAYNVRIRAHLSFDELRIKFTRRGQFVCLMLDAVLWIVFSAIVIYYTTKQVLLSRDNFAIVQEPTKSCSGGSIRDAAGVRAADRAGSSERREGSVRLPRRRP